MIKKFLPKSLLGRIILIVLFPIIMFQLIILFYYYNSLWERTLNRLSRSVAMEIDMVHSSFSRDIYYNGWADSNYIEDEDKLFHETKMLAKHFLMELNISDTLQDQIENREKKEGLVIQSFKNELGTRIEELFYVQENLQGKVSVFIELTQDELGSKYLEIQFPKDRITTSRNHVLLGWLLISSSILIMISFLFLRNQIRPIRKLAKAAEKFGKGQDIGDFKTSGASEVRLASAEFLKMKNRITRQIEQRSLMLAGVSHDLKTPLTRMRLQSETIQDDQIKESLNDEIKHMNEMLTEYLDFSANQDVSSKNIVNPIEALIKIKNDLHFKENEIDLEIINDEDSWVNESIFVRCITNILNNAIENATKIKIKAETTSNFIKINIHDNGLGISDEEKKNVFKPFYRIDKSRNQNISNSGLGLAITKSLLNSINGKITLKDSYLGGLEVVIEIQN